ncbi:MAG: pitrilysin family protein [Planctomycetota bacterium]
MTRAFLIALSLLVFLCAPVLAADAPRRPLADVRRTDLPNGLVVLVAPSRASGIVSARVFVRTGAMMEDEFLGTGASHLLEHLVAGGSTSAHTEDEYRGILASIGGRSNAYTTPVATCYYIDCAGDHLATALEVLSQWVSSASILDVEFDRECEVVTRELQRARIDPERELDRLASETLFPNHPARVPVIGYLDRLKTLTRGDLLRYYAKRYVASNMVVVVTGDVDPGSASSLVRKFFSSIDRGAPLVTIFPDEPVPFAPRLAERDLPTARLVRMRLDFRTVSIFHPDLFPLDCLSYILSRGKSSRLVRRLKYDKPLVLDIDTASFTPQYDGGYFSVSSSLEREKMDAALAAVRDEIKAVQSRGVTAAELAVVIAQMTADYLRQQETVEGLASRVGWDFLTTGDPVFSDYYLSGIARVSPDDVRRVARTYLLPERECLSIIRPSSAPSYLSTASGPSSRPAGPSVEKFALPNGLTLLLGVTPGAATASIQAYGLAGLRAETPETNGINMLTSTLLTAGTRSRSRGTRIQIARLFEDVGASLDGSGGRFTFSLSASLLPAYIERLLPVFAECLFDSAFPPDELERARTTLLAALKGRQESPSFVAMDEWRKLFFARSPYRMDVLGTPETLRAFKRTDVLDWYRRYVVPGNLVVAIFGDFDPHAVLDLARAAFSRFPARPAPVGALAVDSPPDAPREVRRAYPFHEAVIVAGFPSASFENIDDRYPLTVLGAVLAGYEFPAGRLQKALRGGTQGYVYEVHAANAFALEPGYFYVYAMVDPARVDEALGIIKEELRKLVDGPISESELEEARSAVALSFRMDRELPSHQALLAATDELYGLGFAFVSSEPALVDAVSLPDLRRVAKKYLTNPLILVFVPEASAPAPAGSQPSSRPSSEEPSE